MKGNSPYKYPTCENCKHCTMDGDIDGIILNCDINMFDLCAFSGTEDYFEQKKQIKL